MEMEHCVLPYQLDFFKTTLSLIGMKILIENCFKLSVCICSTDFGKGAPARESRTGTRLVSPTPGCEKKKKGYLWNKASERKIEYIRNIISIHRYYCEWYNSWKSPETRKRVKKKNIFLSLKVLPYLEFFFCYVIGQCKLPNKLIFSLPAKYLIKNTV